MGRVGERQIPTVILKISLCSTISYPFLQSNLFCWWGRRRPPHLPARLPQRQAGAVKHGRQEPRRHHAGRKQGVHGQPAGGRGLRRRRAALHGADNCRGGRGRQGVDPDRSGEGEEARRLGR